MTDLADRPHILAQPDPDDWDAAAQGDPDDEHEILDCPYPDCDFNTLSPAGLKRHITRQHGPGREDSSSRPTRQGREEEGRANGEPPSRSATSEEVPPRPPGHRPQAGVMGRLRDRLRNRSSSPGGTPSAKPARSPYRGRRIPIGDDISMMYADIGQRLSYGPLYPNGRLMTYQAPAAGVIFDNAIAGTMLDRVVVQPLWRGKDRWEPLFFLVMPQLITFTMAQLNTQIRAAAERGDMDTARRLDGRLRAEGEMLGWMMRRSLVSLAPAMAEAKKRAEKENAIIAEAFGDIFPDMPPGVDPLQGLLSAMFAPPGAAAGGPIPEEETANVGHDNDND